MLTSSRRRNGLWPSLDASVKGNYCRSYEIDVDRLMKTNKDLPPSPRNARITSLGIASLLAYLVAAFCAWQIGGWWGVGLIACLYIISILDGFVTEEHRQELWQWNGRFARKLSEKSDVLDDIIPKKERNIDNEKSL